MSALPNNNYQMYNKRDLSGLYLYKSGTAQLCGWNIINTNAAIAYIQLFNASDITNVTLGTTSPTLILAVPTGAGSTVFAMISDSNKMSFPLGIVAAATTTPTGSTALGSAMIADLYIN